MSGRGTAAGKAGVFILRAETIICFLGFCHLPPQRVGLRVALEKITK